MPIEPVSERNRDAAGDLLTRFFREEGFTTPRAAIERNLTLMLPDPSCWAALAVEGGAARGIVTVTTMLYVEWGRLGEIGDLYVLPQFRGKGVARELVEAGIRWCAGKSCSAVSVTLTPEGEERHRLSEFYAGLDFRSTGRTIMSRALGSGSDG